MSLFGGFAAALAGGLVSFVGILLMLPKVRAETRKLDAEADDLVNNRLMREIERLDAALKDVLGKLDTLERASEKRERASEAREDELIRENKQLRGEVRRLDRRVRGLEAVLKIVPQITPEMQAVLNRLDNLESPDAE